MRSCTVIVNPAAGRGRALDAVTAAFEGVALDVRIEPTTRPGHGIELAAKAHREGVDIIVAAGGDGTVHEVVNGVLADDTGYVPTLGVLPLGSGCDYAKTFRIPEDIGDAVKLIVSDVPPRTVDAGEVTFREGKRYFANIANCGIGPETVARAARLPKALGSAMYGIAFVLVLPRFKRRKATVMLGDELYEGPLTNLVVANAQVFGGGMRVAPNADPSDGLFDVQLQFGSKIDYVRGLPKVYKGTHVPHPRIREERVGVVTVECDPPAVVEADGEVLGTTPATYRVLPGAIRLKA
ncbi:MAG: diacylglycerol kinase family protein [Actinomycetota bacterium]